MPLARFGAAVFLLICGAVVICIYQVLKYPRALEAWSSSWVATGFRGLALVTMFVSGVAGIGLFFVRPITYALMRTSGEDGIALVQSSKLGKRSSQSGSASRSHSNLIEDRCSQRFRQTPEKLLCRYG